MARRTSIWVNASESVFITYVSWESSVEAVDLVENTQENVRRLDTLKATEALIALVKTADDQFHRVVGLGDDLALDAVHQRGPTQWALARGAPGSQKMNHQLHRMISDWVVVW